MRSFYNTPRFFLFAGAIVLFGFGIAPDQALAEVISEKVTRFDLSNTDCGVQSPCGLKTVRFIERKYRFTDLIESRPEDEAFTQMQVVLDFAHRTAIENFGVVQWIKGCQYESTLQQDGSVEIAYTFVHRHHGRNRLVFHPNAVIDSPISDPLRSSYEGHGRFDLYRWNDDPDDWDESYADWYFFAPPPHSTVFLNDVIGTAGLYQRSPAPTARNSSLDFLTCLFHLNDLPISTDSSGSGIDVNQAITCHRWNHSFEYDFRAQTLTSTQPVSRSCSGPTGPQPP